MQNDAVNSKIKKLKQCTVRVQGTARERESERRGRLRERAFVNLVSFVSFWIGATHREDESTVQGVALEWELNGSLESLEHFLVPPVLIMIGVLWAL